MSIDVFGHSNIGSRAINEDYYCINNESDRCTAVLCDGLGGHECGEVASKLAAENLVNGIEQLDEITPDGINRVLSVVNDGLVSYQMANPESDGMRTTAVGCIIKEGRINYFNVGDSRFYFFRDGGIKYMTKDHSVSQLSVEMGKIAFNDIRGDADRSKLLRVLGEQARGDSVGTIYKEIGVRPGDAFLLCSDGFWEYILEEEMEVDLAKAHSAEEWVNFMLIRLLLRVGGDNDNFTVIGGIIDGASPEGVVPLSEDDLREWSHTRARSGGMPDFAVMETTKAPEAVEGHEGASADIKKTFLDPQAEPQASHAIGARNDIGVKAGSRSDRGHLRRKRVKKVLGVPMTRSNKVIIAFIIMGVILAVGIKACDFVSDKGGTNSTESPEQTVSVSVSPDTAATGSADTVSY